MADIGILGAGGWGIALSSLLHYNKHNLTLWEFNPEEYKLLLQKREHPKKLPGVKIPNEVKLTNELSQAVLNQDLILLALPSHTVREVAEKIKIFDLKNAIVVNLAKGIEEKTFLRMSEVLKEILPLRQHNRITTLSGPSHAEEVARKIPTTVVVAGFDFKVTEEVQKIFSTPFFRVYTNADLIGVELAGSLKNIIAIAAGICDGLEFGDNTKGALLTRGLAEIIRLGEKLGANPLTFAGLSGIGDLITTCISKYSRNRYVGEQIAQKKKLKQILQEMVMVAEGVKTTNSAYQLSLKYKVEMPITTEVYNVLFQDKDPKEAVTDLMQREPKNEIWS
jgi:glycerol-3-phosphate dehydrogenase (NAD(P)+)